MQSELLSYPQKNNPSTASGLRLTEIERRVIISTGRDDALEQLLPSVFEKSRYPMRGMAALLLIFMLSVMYGKC